MCVVITTGTNCESSASCWRMADRLIPAGRGLGDLRHDAGKIAGGETKVIADLELIDRQHIRRGG